MKWAEGPFLVIRWWPAVTQKRQNLQCFFRLLLARQLLSLSLSQYSHHKNPKAYVATSDNWSYLKQTSSLMENGGKLVLSYWMHTDDIGGAGERKSCKFLFPFTGKAGEGSHPKVPSATSLFFFPYPIRLEGTEHWTVKIRHLNSFDPHFKAFVCI